MRFVRGRTLHAAVVAYHRRRAEGAAGPLELRELLAAFVGVCNAVGYAHSRGVLHRDLKPHNVVLGDYGEVIVLDWGVARIMGQADGEAEPLELSAEGQAEATAQGQVLGTPAYMAPEQAEGRLDRLGPATDVYGLGAILYEILTGRPPFSGGAATAVLRQVVHEAPQRPRSVTPGAPAGLEAVCLKALAKKPGERYATAKELADDVRRWLADEAVSAYAEPLGPRLARRARRHRSVVAGVGAALAVGVVSLALAAAWLAATNQKLQAANAAETAAKQEAQEHEARSIPGKGPRPSGAADGRSPGGGRARVPAGGGLEQPRVDPARPEEPGGGLDGPADGPGGRGETGRPLPQRRLLPCLPGSDPPEPRPGL
jgi:hypothetical protein